MIQLNRIYKILAVLSVTVIIGGLINIAINPTSPYWAPFVWALIITGIPFTLITIAVKGHKIGRLTYFGFIFASLILLTLYSLNYIPLPDSQNIQEYISTTIVGIVLSFIPLPYVLFNKIDYIKVYREPKIGLFGF